MSFHDGWDALNLRMPARVPRTEYSTGLHHELLTAVTGIAVGERSSPELKARAIRAFHRKWNFDFHWNILTYRQPFERGPSTRMGHAEYMAGGVDRDDHVRCPFTDPEEVLRFNPADTYGLPDRVRLRQAFEQHYREACRADPDAVNMTGIYITCISGLIEIFGWDMLLLAMGTDGERCGQMTNRYAAWIQHWFDALAEADVPVVMVHDDIVWTSGPFVHPDWYRRYVFPNYRRLLAPLRDSGKRIAYTSDGNYTMFVDDIAAAGVHGFVMEPLTDMKRVAERYGKTHFFIGNADTRVLLSGSREQIRAEVERCMAIGKTYPGFFMAVGNHIPPNTPLENALYYNEVYEKMARR